MSGARALSPALFRRMRQMELASAEPTRAPFLMSKSITVGSKALDETRSSDADSSRSWTVHIHGFPPTTPIPA